MIAAAPRGQIRPPTSRLTPAPSATSSKRTSPTRQPAGASRSKSTSTTTLNAAWLAAKEIAWPAYDASSTASGSTAQSTPRSLPTASRISPPMKIPANVPSSARAIEALVESAFERSTDIVPSTIQKPCWRSVSCATSTASASPIAPRTLLRNHTESVLACVSASRVPAPIRIRRDCRETACA